jgi:hypothetical protein
MSNCGTKSLPMLEAFAYINYESGYEIKKKFLMLTFLLSSSSSAVNGPTAEALPPEICNKMAMGLQPVTSTVLLIAN